MIEIRTIDLSSREFTELINFKGQFFNDWLNNWDTLTDYEKDFSTHPILILSWLKSFSEPTFSSTKLFMFYNNKNFISS